MADGLLMAGSYAPVTAEFCQGFPFLVTLRQTLKINIGVLYETLALR